MSILQCNLFQGVDVSRFRPVLVNEPPQPVLPDRPSPTLLELFLEGDWTTNRIRKMLASKDMMTIYCRNRRLFLIGMALMMGIWVSPIAHGQGGPPVDVNTADMTTLTNLAGITPIVAKRIIKGRPYHTLEDLAGVQGLTQAKLQALAGQVTFGTNVVTGASGSAKKATTNKVGPGEKININKATATELARLPGIGKSKAQAIVDYRTQNGDFKVLEDIEKVKGIKAGLFARLKDHIELSD